MSWHMNVTGTKEEICEAVDMHAASPNGIPPGVAAYIKDVVSATKIVDGKQLIHVSSTGHRPMEYGLANEEVVVQLLPTLAGLKP